MTIPVKYRKTPSVVASYDWADIKGGTGIQNFYAGEASGAIVGSSSGFVMSPNTFYSDRVMHANAIVSTDGSYQLVEDVKFDAYFNNPVVIKGIGIVNVPIGLSGASASHNFSTYVSAHLFHYDGTTETSLIEGSGSAILKNTDGGVGYGYAVSAIYLNIPETLFKSGDYLRLQLKQYGHQTEGATGYALLAHDPMNRATSINDSNTFGTNPTTLIMQVPFKIDV